MKKSVFGSYMIADIIGSLIGGFIGYSYYGWTGFVIGAPIGALFIIGITTILSSSK